MKTYFNIARVPREKRLFSYKAHTGRTRDEKRVLLQNVMEGAVDVFGRRAARRMARRVFNF